MRKMKQTFDVSKLVESLHQTLLFTEDVKHLLKSDCNEATFTLKPWYMEVDNQQVLNEDACTCPKAETEIEEIAAGISRTLQQTQQLREKLSLNTVKGKNSKHVDISKIYNHQTAGDKERKQKKDINVVKQNIKKINLNEGSKNKAVKEETKYYHKQAITHSGKSIKNKNFLAINKCNIKNMNEVMKHKNNNCEAGDNSKFSNSTTKLSDTKSTTSTSELKSLIQKVSSKSDNNSSSNTCSMKCPVHEDVILQSKQGQNFIAVNVMDSINLCNIPGEIVKVLKVYHTYLNSEFSKKSINEKQSKVVNKFLTEFNKMDKIVQKTLIQKTHDITLLPKYMSFIQILFSEDVQAFNSKDIKTMYTELQSTWKKFGMKELDIVQTMKSNIQTLPPNSAFDLTEWMLNGIWNPSTIKNFKGMSMVCCICYTSENRLLLFFELLQQLQYIHYHKDLIDMLLKDVLPNIKTYHSTQSEYVKIYKMIYILCQGLNPKVPVLVSTNK